MSKSTGPTWLVVVCVVAATVTASRAGAQSTAPVTGQGGSSNVTPAAPAAVVQATGCSTIRTPASAGGASIVQDAGDSLEHKSWQPIGGQVQFTVRSFVAIPANASVFTCFRWKSGGKLGEFIESSSRLELSGDGKTLKVTTTVPNLGPQPNEVAKALPLVPLTEVRIVAIDSQNVAKADVTTEIGVTYAAAAFVFAIAVMILGFVILYAASSFRLKHVGILKANWFLRIISTPSGFASLSQLQIVLWTFVVAMSAVYVMSLSGELIQITNGTLVLLGIAGATGIGAKVHTEAQGAAAETSAATAAADKAAADVIAAQKAAAAAAPPPANPVDAARITEENRAAANAAADKAVIANATRARADAMKNPPPTQTPKWSDLIINESLKDDGTVTREIDVARFQMLLFTLITAAFVLMNVVTTYVIPEISTGFQTLMGISNGVYLGSKVAQRS